MSRVWVSVTKIYGKCPGCGQWNTLVEEMEPVVSSRRLNYANAIQTEVTKPRRLTEVETKSEARIETKFQEFNRVLGGGIVDGSLVLIGGDRDWKINVTITNIITISGFFI